ncbi:hypothetical protein [Bradyrhizobium sp. 192]|uniref:hypothetical protein n=1 Tax=Bradyrhizobium sp. 192 TaxID=2782660 RepID=UPI001FFEC5F3|nr:hypothetical protein [Bradyrhizobium sp. 192]UPJ57640.1 hypothetical protein IVB24_34675 [Bradyrhizobium sp. 192]
MTLVLVIPTVAGLIVAADSRLGISTPDWTIVCDNVFKITEVEGVDRTVVFTSGYGTIWALAGVQTDKVCEHVASNKPKFDAQAILANTARGPGASLEDIAREVVLATAAYIASHPADYATRIGQFLFQSALARFDPDTRRASVESFSVTLGVDLSVSATDLKTQQYFPIDGCGLKVFGEANYLTNAVFNGPGRQFLGERYGRFRNAMTTIEHAEAEPAADFAVEIIEAASRTTSIVPSETGIGGPVDIVLVGDDTRPQRLRWKSGGA